jgi:hypothetical protein
MEEHSKTIRAILTGLISLLLSLNIFFVKRLVDEIDDTKQAVHGLSQTVALLSYRLDETARVAQRVCKKKGIQYD